MIECLIKPKDAGTELVRPTLKCQMRTHATGRVYTCIDMMRCSRYGGVEEFKKVAHARIAWGMVRQYFLYADYK